MAKPVCVAIGELPPGDVFVMAGPTATAAPVLFEKVT
jgi:hypothetical protein